MSAIFESHPDYRSLMEQQQEPEAAKPFVLTDEMVHGTDDMAGFELEAA